MAQHSPFVLLFPCLRYEIPAGEARHRRGPACSVVPSCKAAASFEEGSTGKDEGNGEEGRNGLACVAAQHSPENKALAALVQAGIAEDAEVLRLGEAAQWEFVVQHEALRLRQRGQRGQQQQLKHLLHLHWRRLR